MPAKPFAFHDLPARSFPFVIEYLTVGDDELVHRTEVSGPGIVEVPSLAGHGPTWVRVSYADGRVAEWRPDAG